MNSLFERVAIPVVVAAISASAGWFAAVDQRRTAESEAIIARNAERRALMDMYLKLVKDPNPAVRGQAVDLLKVLDAEFSAAILEALATDERQPPEVTTAAKRALGRPIAAATRSAPGTAEAAGSHPDAPAPPKKLLPTQLKITLTFRPEPQGLPQEELKAHFGKQKSSIAKCLASGLPDGVRRIQIGLNVDESGMVINVNPQVVLGEGTLPAAVVQCIRQIAEWSYSSAKTKSWFLIFVE